MRTSAVEIGPQRDLTLDDLVTIARGDGRAARAKLELDCSWREACQPSLDHLHLAMQATGGKSTHELAQLVRQKFAGRTPPAAMADLLTAPASPENDRQLAARAAIYGVTTGFGMNKDQRIESIDQIHE